MMSCIVKLLVVVAQYVLVSSQAVDLECRVCNNAETLDNCTTIMRCSQTEACYMDELITDQLTIVYTGGCRARAVCGGSITGLGPSAVGRKRNALVACSRCCNIEAQCNTKLCGIKGPTVTRNLTDATCYSCSNTQGVTRPQDCHTSTICEKNEMCYGSQFGIGGHDSIYYGCQTRQYCTSLMKAVFTDLDHCAGQSDPSTCDSAVLSTCHTCCGGGYCNHDNCVDINNRLYMLYKGGQLNMTTLRQIN